MFTDDLTATATQVQARLDDVLSTLPASRVRDAMVHASTGGKRLRAYLVMQSALVYGVGDAALDAACAIEALHAYSLVHDDMPCMDDDDIRRGMPTVHRKWDEPTAVLAGDALQSLAFELVSGAGVPNASVLTRELAKAAGARGMVLGQALDIEAETASTPLTVDDIAALQRGKTGALIEWSAAAGARMAGEDPEPMLRYARALGLAFQIADDLLDVEGDSATVGKATGKDADAGKATFVSILGVAVARDRARALVAEAQEALAPFDSKADGLRAAAEFVIDRKA